MRRTAWAVLALAVAGCGGPSATDLPPPAADRAQIAVAVSAAPRPGVRPSRGEDGYDGPEAGRAYARVDYRKMPDIAVVVTGAGLPADGPVPRTARLVARADGFDRGLVLLGPDGRTTLEIENRLDRELNVFCLGRGDERDGFDIAIPAREARSVTLREPGVYGIACVEEPSLTAEAVVAGSSHAILVRSGGTALFDGLPPGTWEVTVRAPRLPSWRTRIEAPAGRRTEVPAVLTVGNLQSAGK